MALDMLRMMGSERVRADVVLGGAVLSSCEQEGSWKEAFEILDCALSMAHRTREWWRSSPFPSIFRAFEVIFRAAPDLIL